MAKGERPMIHIRLPKELIKRIDYLRVDWELDRAHCIQKVLQEALPRIEEAEGFHRKTA